MRLIQWAHRFQGHQSEARSVVEFIWSQVWRLWRLLNARDVKSVWWLFYVCFWDNPDLGTIPDATECPVLNESERINCIPDQPPTKVWVMDLAFHWRVYAIGWLFVFVFCLKLLESCCHCSYWRLRQSNSVPMLVWRYSFARGRAGTFFRADRFGN